MTRLLPFCLLLLLAAWACAQSSALRDAAEAMQRGDYARATVAGQRAVSADPQSAPAWKLLGMALAAQNLLEDAFIPFSKACELNAREPGACYYLGRTAYYLSRLDQAESAFRLAMKSVADRARATLGLAMVLAAQNKPAEADRLFRTAIDGKAEGALRDYGLFLYGQGRSEEAIKALEQAGATEELARVRKELAAAPKAKAPARLGASIAFDSTTLPMTTRNGAAGDKHLVETMMGGVAVLDYDSDGFPDIYVTNGAAIPSLTKTDASYWNRLFRNRGDGSFEDVTEAAGVAGKGYTMGAAAGDFDGDGWMDLYVVGVRENILYRNRGNGRFEDLTASAGVDGGGKWGVGAAWLDYDRDGRLDLFVARYVEWNPDEEPFCGDRKPEGRTYCHPKLYQPLSNLLYRNEGGGKFRDVSAETGIAKHPGKGMGLAIGDFDNDGWLDVFVGNDTLPNFLFLNRGGRFEEAATESGVALLNDGRPISSMGASAADFDGDGNEDLVVSALSNETFPLFRNLGASSFQDITAPSGLAVQSLPYSGWGVGFVDLDNDGHLDIFTANGHVMDNAELTSSRASKQPNTVFRSLGNGRFELQALSGSNTIPAEAFHRGAAFADFDRDGRMDVVVARLNDSPLVMLNRTAGTGHWITLHFKSDAIGARVRATTKAGVQWGRLAPSFSYASSSEHAIHLGLGDNDRVQELKVLWPDGCVQMLADLPADQHLHIERKCGN